MTKKKTEEELKEELAKLKMKAMGETRYIGQAKYETHAEIYEIKGGTQRKTTSKRRSF